jgi:hypothetical protein
MGAVNLLSLSGMLGSGLNSTSNMKRAPHLQKS